MTTAFSPFKHTPAEREAGFMRLYNPLLAEQTLLKTRLASLFCENRRVRALFYKIPESDISIDSLDFRENKNAPQLKDLLSPGDSDEAKEGKERDEWLLNNKKILGAIEIDIASMEDEIKALEKDTRWFTRRVSERAGDGEGSQSDVMGVLHLEQKEGKEVMESMEVVPGIEASEQEMMAIRETAETLEERAKDSVHGANGDSEKEEVDEGEHC